MTRLCVTSVLAALWLAPAGLRAQDAPEASVERTKRAVVHADTLWALAGHFYKDPRQWTRIYEANKDTIKDPHWIYPNQVFIIPGFDVTVQVVKTGQKEPVPEEAPAALPDPAPPAAAAPFVPAAAPAPAPAAVEEAPPARPEVYQANRVHGAIPLPESLSLHMPEDMTSGQPSAYRLLMPKAWHEDGEVLAYKDHEAFAAEGDSVQIRLAYGARVVKGMRFTVFRRSGATEADGDAEALYLEKVAVLQVVKRLPDSQFLPVYRAVVLRSGGVVQTGDLVKAGE